jgi:hypothetical protein
MESGGFEERAQLGERLARQLDTEGDRDRVLGLLLDDEDTAVTYRTALALLERRDRLGLELIVVADARADDDTRQWLSAAVAQFRALSLGADDDFLRVTLDELSNDGDHRTGRAASTLLREVT